MPNSIPWFVSYYNFKWFANCISNWLAIRSGLVCIQFDRVSWKNQKGIHWVTIVLSNSYHWILCSIRPASEVIAEELNATLVGWSEARRNEETRKPNLQTGSDFRTRTKRGKHQRFPLDESSKLCWDATEQQKRGLNVFQIKSACAKQDLRNMKSQKINSVRSSTQYVANVKGNKQKKGCTDQLFISSNISK